MMKPDETLASLEALAIEAGQEILRIRAAGAGTRRKDDGSPVTDADCAAEEHIIAGIERLYPGTPIIAEESCLQDGGPEIPVGDFFLVDPLDGTKEFIKGKSDFTVNIAIARNGKPCVGVVVAPARNELFSGAAGKAFHCRLAQDGKIDERRQIATRAVDLNTIAAVVSASHADARSAALLDRMTVERKLSIGSSLKFCLVAAGEADIYPRFGRTMQWDTAAGDAVLRNAGGCTTRPDGSLLTYGPSGADGINAFENPHFIAFGGTHDALRDVLSAFARHEADEAEKSSNVPRRA
jgi:3'(2'), 5'-bisphosphate nucleotidase